MLSVVGRQRLLTKFYWHFVLLAFQVFTQIIAQFARGNGQVRVFALME